MDALRVLEELGEPGRLPVEAIRAAEADRGTMVPIFLRSIDSFLSLEGPLACGCPARYSTRSSVILSRRRRTA